MAAFADDEDEYAEVTDEEKFAIASQILLQSPPGQIKEVLKDLKHLCSDEILTDEAVAGVFHQYNNTMQQVIGPIICDEATEIEDQVYIDPAAQTSVRVDPLHQKVEDADASADFPLPEFPADLQEYREAIEAAMNGYISKQFVPGTTTLSVVCGATDSELLVILSGEKINLKNYWSGRWRSRFIVSLEEKCLYGWVKINCHTFEDGNVQLSTEKNVDDEALSFDDPESLGAAVTDTISTIESNVQESLEDMYVNMSQEAFKDMRRALPITRQKMDWSGAQMQLAKGFGKSK
mmetsp:Transcript_10291/g.20204  ORF Transcript_10291/g.20204 Transcript_10291/m.20204 type:complete len:292 (+) Transcript_10291:248-1123(+)|eukprot:CAMPEP_0171501094 /NCGR_PEP_ID=MMETSP0958-20121227/9367_1 /TAXON_ID=87120 /ORGANISM="Aurantiochytrium limacinum, Strain ATCCMYA-1381" /LENGTH=291 /DNA_ID=CAMNT_0012035871 /DNA_START=175 /DNA_END=1050 /DNA_ORIENTATION=-